MFQFSHIIAKRVVKLSLLSFFIVCFMYMTLMYFASQAEQLRLYAIKIEQLKGNGCKFPRLNPFDPTIMKYYEAITGDIVCTGKRYLDMVANTVILNETAVRHDYPTKNFSCYYKPILRNPSNLTTNADRRFGYGSEKSLEYNRILPDEFIKINCKVDGKKVHEEFLAATPLKPEVEKRCEEASKKHPIKNKMNVIIIGIDSISKLNFERHFKLTGRYLKEELKAFDFNGYAKVGDNTFPNLTPFYTGHFVEHYYNSSVANRYFDDLDFIWKNFSSLGYRTLYAEDAPTMGTYQYIKNGFQYPPTDYFFRPFTLAIEDTPFHKKSKVNCLQSRKEIVVLFNYLRSFLRTMQKRPLFAVTFGSRLTHGYLNHAGYADKPAYELLRDIHEMGILNESLLIFFSDHGIRFGGIRSTYVGKIEERMPFIFLRFPEWFMERNPTAVKNLKINQNRLTTPFDIHETLVQLYKEIAGEIYIRESPYGISLFEEIPISRGCKEAHILPHWCVCQTRIPVSTSDPKVIKVANALIETINNFTLPYRNLCSQLKLKQIADARTAAAQTDLLRYVELEKSADEHSIVFGKPVDVPVDYLITVIVSPSDAQFESTVRYQDGSATVLGDVSRINEYGNQSGCIENFNLRKYCYCN